jgi:hypothetical protein
MAKGSVSTSAVASPARRGQARSKRDSALVTVRVLPEQKAFLSRLGDGSLSLGFDRALAAAHAADMAR